MQMTRYNFTFPAGLGYEIAKWLAIMGADVVVACRSEERAKEVNRV